MIRKCRPIDLKKYPIVEQCYNLVRELDSLPASPEVVELNVRASNLMEDIWNYFEARQTTANLASLMEHALKTKYLGKKIYSKFTGVVFTVEDVEVAPDGPDPQMTVSLRSKKCVEAVTAWKNWQLRNNPLGTIPTSQVPPEIRKLYEEACRENFWVSQVTDMLPEIVE